MIKAGIYGASGYAGQELVQLIMRHPNVQIGFATSETFAEQCLNDLYPQAPALPLVSAKHAPLEAIDVAFLCLPHAAAAETAVSALNAGKTVIDLSADFRLKNPTIYAEWYGDGHPAPELMESAVYGLTEFARADLPNAQLVATPGCYPTSILLPLQPLLASGAPIAAPIIADSKSGVTGAGRKASLGTHFVTVADNFKPYKIGRSHRHVPEMEQAIAAWHANPPALIFSPHLLPIPRGILSTIYVTLADDWSLPEIHDLYTETYSHEPFVDVLPNGQLTTIAHVVNSNKCTISLSKAGQTLIITSAIDNLLKGAAGQALQNMNVVYGLEETLGLS